ncbi:hypothetical protein [Salmonella enterica]
MKLAVRNISTSESHVTGSASIDSNLLWATFPFCSFQVCVDRVDGKSLEQYESELLEKARERIAEMYKEIVCGGETGEAGGLLDCLRGKIEPTEFSCKMKLAINDAATDKDLEERVALLEKRLEKTREHTPGVNQESDNSLVVRGADGSVRVRMNAEKQAGLKVTVSDKDDALWMRNSATLEGISSRGYLKDGTQQKIIAALEHALGQARGELLCWNNTDGVADVGATAT